jgi:DNA-binding MarR family transcriptional regulator
MVACLGKGEAKVALGAEPDRLLEVLRNTIIGMVRREGRDLSARQFAVMMLISDLEGSSHTVRELALRLNVPKPSITRGVDRLVELGLARRAPDPRDGRSVLVQRTSKGTDLMGELRQLLRAAMKPK